MTSRPFLSAVAPNYEYARFSDRFSRCMEMPARGLGGAEIIAVYDGGADDSLEKLAEWRGRLGCARFFEVRTQVFAERPDAARESVRGSCRG
jgi:hypothetical protein